MDIDALICIFHSKRKPPTPYSQLVRMNNIHISNEHNFVELELCTLVNICTCLL